MSEQPCEIFPKNVSNHQIAPQITEIKTQIIIWSDTNGSKN